MHNTNESPSPPPLQTCNTASLLLDLTTNDKCIHSNFFNG